MRRSWQMTSAFSRAGRSGGSQALQLPRVSLSRGSPPYFLCSRSRPAEVGIFLHGIASLHRRGREHITHIGLRRICNGWNPSIKERVKFLESYDYRSNSDHFPERGDDGRTITTIALWGFAESCHEAVQVRKRKKKGPRHTGM